MAYLSFKKYAADADTKKWDNIISRKTETPRRQGDLRSEFEVDYNRIIHCNAYRRLKHKTQVFFATRNDHICTRIEHVTHVNSVAYSIARHLGLNTELTTAIAVAHDLGHAPFGHRGETILNEILMKQNKELFWHEKNSLRFVDLIETLPDSSGYERNLNLVYGVRDGIICHCGEIHQNGLKPRDEFIELEKIQRPNEYSPYTWEGCVMKISDKIAFLGRDIEDALSIGLLSEKQLSDLRKILHVELVDVNNTALMHRLITDLCNNSSPEKGICFSDEGYQLIKDITKFNYENIYLHKRMENYHQYAELVLKTIFDALMGYYDGKNTLKRVLDDKETYHWTSKIFYGWLEKYSNALENSASKKYKNEVLYKLENREDYVRCIIDFISGMTDHFAIRVFEELISF